MVVTLPLFLSDIGGSEIFLILVVILMFFGSKGIPGIARTLGKTIRQVKDASQEVQNEIRKSSDEMKSDFNLQNMLTDTVRDIEQPLQDEAFKLDQAIQTPTQFSKPFGVNPPQAAQPNVEEVTSPLVSESPNEESPNSTEEKA